VGRFEWVHSVGRGGSYRWTLLFWGDPTDPMEAAANLDPKYIHNGIMGAP